jgi:hypothetical protein
LFLPIIAYTPCSTKLEIRANEFLPGNKRLVGVMGGMKWGREEVGEMTQSLYPHMNKIFKMKKNEIKKNIP